MLWRLLITINSWFLMIEHRLGPKIFDGLKWTPPQIVQYLKFSRIFLGGRLYPERLPSPPFQEILDRPLLAIISTYAKIVL